MPEVAGAGADDWSHFHRRLDRLTLPQRPDARIAARVAAEIAAHDERVLLLGVTRELAGLGRDLTAVDYNPEQIERVWIGDRPDRRALLADWRGMTFPAGRFTAAIGDGSFSALTWPQGCTETLARIGDALEPGGRLVVRCFLAPDEPEPVERVAGAVFSGAEPCFHALKWRLAMALANGERNVLVADIYDAFERAFPDRAALARLTGWDGATINLIDAYRDSALVYSFPTRAEMLRALPDAFRNARFVSSGRYPLSERCPFLVAERAA